MKKQRSSKKSAPRSRTRHGSRKRILAVFKSAGTEPKRSSQIFAALKGASIPAQSVYQALRTLVKRKQLSVRKEGRERVYTWIGDDGAASAKKAGRAAKAPRAPAAASGMTESKGVLMPTEEAAEIAEESAMAVVAAEPRERTMHHLVPGEIVILQVHETHVEAAANVQGKLEIQKHRRK